jgi:quaternary ammonium compound-resistance protein SugE
MPWLYLILAAICEMAWPIGFKYTNGFKSNYPLIALTMAIMITSFALLSQATNKGIPIGTAYAVWTGLGAAGTAILGIALFHDPKDPIRLACLSLIILGAIGLKFLSPPEQPQTSTTVPTTPPPTS